MVPFAALPVQLADNDELTVAQILAGVVGIHPQAQLARRAIAGIVEPGELEVIRVLTARHAPGPSSSTPPGSYVPGRQPDRWSCNCRSCTTMPGRHPRGSIPT